MESAATFAIGTLLVPQFNPDGFKKIIGEIFGWCRPASSHTTCPFLTVPTVVFPSGSVILSLPSVKNTVVQ